MASGKSNNSAVFHNLDWPVIVIYLLLVAFGAISIYAASYDYDNASIFSFDEFSGKQIRWIGLGLVLGLFLLLIDKRMYETYAYPVYFAVLLLLIVTLFVAHDIKGSRSWITFGSFSIQPAEFAKFATALALAKLFSGYNFRLNASASNYIRAIAIIFAPIVLILAQKETGSALVYLSLVFVLYREGMSGLVLFAMLFAIVIFVVTVKFSAMTALGVASGQLAIFIMVALAMILMTAFYGKSTRIARNLALGFIVSTIVLFCLCRAGIALPGLPLLLGLIGAAILYLLYEAIIRHTSARLFIPIATAAAAIAFMFSTGYVFNNVLQPHQQMRIKVALGIEDDILSAGYNVNQSKIAIGSGGFTGKGFLQGTQTKLKYVPEQHTDFIFCTIGEEEGFVGSIVVLALFLALILRVVAIAERQPGAFGRVYAYCVASYLTFHLLVNVGMVIGLCPVIGIPLPFFSYGGSSLWGFTLLIFILLRIDASRKEH